MPSTTIHAKAHSQKYCIMTPTTLQPVAPICDPAFDAMINSTRPNKRARQRWRRMRDGMDVRRLLKYWWMAMVRTRPRSDSPQPISVRMLRAASCADELGAALVL